MEKQKGFSLNALFVLGVLLVFANGCENEEQRNEPVVPELAGAWAISDSNVGFYISYSNQPLSEYLTRGLDWEYDAIQAKEKQLEKSLRVELEGMITLSPDKTYQSNFVKSSANGEWALSKNGKVLILFQDPLAPSHVDLEIVSFESGKCKFRHTEYFELDENSFIRAEVTMTLTK